MVFGKIWNFVKRHKKKFMFTGVVIGGVYYLGKYAQSRLKSFQDKEAAECLAHARRQHHFDSNQRTCNMTVLSMIPSLREALLQALDSESLTMLLKNKPANKMEIWEDLKIMSITRTLVAVYSSAMLTVVLRVQLNILGGYIYLDSLKSKNGTIPENAVANSQVQQRYLAMIQYLLDQGLKDLITSVQEAVKEKVGSLSLKQLVSLEDLQQIISQVRNHTEYRQHNGYHDETASGLCQYMLPTETGEQNVATKMSDDDLTYCKMMKETREMLDSGDFHLVLAVCLDSAFSHLLDRLAEYFKPTPPEDTEDVHNIVSLNAVTMPLAKVIPVMNGLVHSVLADAPNTFVQELLLKEQVKDFAANVYEAFSQAPQLHGPD